jgi:hypothetical protein
MGTQCSHPNSVTSGNATLSTVGLARDLRHREYAAVRQSLNWLVNTYCDGRDQPTMEISAWVTVKDVARSVI